MNISARKPSKKSVEDLSHMAALAVKAGKLAIFEWNIVTDVCIADSMLCDLFGLGEGPWTGSMVLDRIHPEDRDKLNDAIEQTLVDNVDYDTSFRVGTDDDFTWIGGRGRVVERDEAGAAIRMMGVNWDMSQAKAAEARQIALAREMDHRVNNGYAIIEATIAVGAEEYDCPPPFAQLLKTQIHALSAAHQLASDFLLHEQMQGRGLSLGSILRKALRLVPDELLDAHLDEGLTILPQQAAAMSMLMHHICGQARKDASALLHVKALAEGKAELVWTSGYGANAPQTTPDFLVSLCLEQLGGTLTTYSSTEQGQNITMILPVAGHQVVRPS